MRQLTSISLFCLAGLLTGCETTSQHQQPTQSSQVPAQGNAQATQQKFIWPVAGAVVQPFNTTIKGINIAAPFGSPVFATADGKVMYASNGVRGLGNLIIINHDGGFITAYAHNNRMFVTPGASVKAGQQIAEVGNTGDVSTPQLHFGIKLRDSFVDPLAYLPKQNASIATAAPSEESLKSDSDTCEKYGFKKNTNQFADCMMKIDLARREMQQQQAYYNQQMLQYQQQVAAQEAERKRRQSANVMEMGLRMMGGQAPLDAAVSVGTGAPITPPQMPSSTRTYYLPNNKTMTCTSTGSVVNCF